MKKLTTISLLFLSLLFLSLLFKYEKFEGYGDNNIVNCNKYKYLCSNKKLINQYEPYQLLRGINIETDNILEKKRK